MPIPSKDFLKILNFRVVLLKEGQDWLSFFLILLIYLPCGNRPIPNSLQRISNNVFFMHISLLKQINLIVYGSLKGSANDGLSLCLFGAN